MAWLCVAVLFGCEPITAPPPAPPLHDENGSAGKNGQGISASATGGGHYLIGGALDVQFSLNANQRADGTAKGQFRHSVAFDGLLVEFHGEVTCLSVDPEQGRAWIGGVVKHNNSTDPDFREAIHQPGRDVWFRVLDSGEGQAAPDRTTFLGFEGAAGIITSEEYCEAQIWPGPPDDEDNARTHPVTQGNIQVRP